MGGNDEATPSVSNPGIARPTSPEGILVQSPVDDIVSHTKKDAVAPTDTLSALFKELDLTEDAGPFLDRGLRVVQETYTIIEDVKDSKIESVCEDFARKAMLIFQNLALAAKSSGRPILPGTAVAVLVERVISRLKTFQADLQAYARLSEVWKLLHIREVKRKLEARKQELESTIDKLTAHGTLIQLVQSDYTLDRDTDRKPAESEASQPQEAGTGDFTILSFHNLRAELQRVMTSVLIAWRRRKTSRELQTEAGSSPSLLLSPSIGQHRFTSDEIKSLTELQGQLRLILFGSDGEPTAGQKDETPASNQYTQDPAKSVQILADICKSDGSISYNDVFNKMRDLIANLGQLGLFGETMTARPS
ncbi:unnamed protein product [Tilletia controversa]|nr:unnamed protein product [Tilletia controversa]